MKHLAISLVLLGLVLFGGCQNHEVLHQQSAQQINENTNEGVHRICSSLQSLTPNEVSSLHDALAKHDTRITELERGLKETLGTSASSCAFTQGLANANKAMTSEVHCKVEQIQKASQCQASEIEEKVTETLNKRGFTSEEIQRLRSLTMWCLSGWIAFCALLFMIALAIAFAVCCCRKKRIKALKSELRKTREELIDAKKCKGTATIHDPKLSPQ